MAYKTATAFSLALFPRVSILERVLNADVVFALSDRRLDVTSHANRCVIRSSTESIRSIEIPVKKKSLRIDDAEVPECATWLPKLQEELQRAYRGLPMSSAACELVSKSMSLPFSSPWLTDYLMHAFVTTLKYLGWTREIVRGPSEQRRRYVVDAEYLLDLCLENECNRFIVGTDPDIKYRELFRTEGVTVEPQRWQGTTTLRGRDSILDAIARFSVADVLKTLSTKN